MGFIMAKKDVCIPYMPIEVKFLIREEMELNPFQQFLIEAIQDGATIEQIAIATQLTTNVIKLEIFQLEAQKLVSSNNDRLEITDLSQQILFVARKVKELNEEKKAMCINLITGNIDCFEKEQYVTTKEDDIILQHKIWNLDGISIEDNLEFFSQKFDCLNTCEEEEKRLVLSSSYVEIYRKKDDNSNANVIYRRITTKRLPCLIGDDSNLCENKDSNVLMEGFVKRIFFDYTFDKEERYNKVLSELERMNAVFPELLSKKAHEMLKLKKLCSDYKKSNIQVLYDMVSGKMMLSNEDKNEIKQERNRPQMVLDGAQFKSKEEEKFVDYIINKLEIDRKIIISVKLIEKQKYNLRIPLDALWEEL